VLEGERSTFIIEFGGEYGDFHHYPPDFVGWSVGSLGSCSCFANRSIGAGGHSISVLASGRLASVLALRTLIITTTCRPTITLRRATPTTTIAGITILIIIIRIIPDTTLAITPATTIRATGNGSIVTDLS
jgi:hypothetical protein